MTQSTELYFSTENFANTMDAIWEWSANSGCGLLLYASGDRLIAEPMPLAEGDDDDDEGEEIEEDS